MNNYVIQRLAQVVPTIIGVTFFVFLTMSLLPGDPVRIAIERGMVHATDEQIEQQRQRLGLDRPFIVQYGLWMGRVVQGDLGISFHTGRRVRDLVANNIMATVELGLVSIIFAIVTGVPLGVFSALRRGTWWDTGATIIAVAGVSIPNFWLGLLLIWFFGLTLGWLPSFGLGTWQHLVLPAVTLGTGSMAIIARLTRSSLVEILQQDYITTAHAKGLRKRTVAYKHALGNALIPVVTIIALSLGTMLSGTIIVENVFGRPGLGRLAVEGLIDRDYPIVQATVLVLGLTVVVANLLADLTYAVIDPRIRYG